MRYPITKKRKIEVPIEQGMDDNDNDMVRTMTVTIIRQAGNIEAGR
jgi:hypothetical protein